MSKNILIISFLWCIATPLWADDIKLGMTTALTGNSAALGNNIRAGVESYFNYINQQGGVQGRQLKLLVKDDGYEPERAARNMREMIDQDKVLAIIGNVGTPTAIVTVPITNEKKTLLFGAFSGGDVLRDNPPSRYVMNYRPSYAEETEKLITGILESGIKAEEIAFFTQQDGFGNAGYMGGINALKRHGYHDTGKLWHVRYSRNSLNVEAAVATLLNAPIQPKAIIMAGSYAPSARFIELLQQELPETWFFNLSFVGSYALREALPSDARNVVVTQVVPDMRSHFPIIDEYLTHLKQYSPTLEPNDVSLEGYIIAKIFYQGLISISGEITKESIIDGLEQLNKTDIGLGIPISYSKLNHQAIDKLWMITINKGKLEPFGWSRLTTLQEQ